MKVGTNIKATLSDGTEAAGLVTKVHSDTCVNAVVFRDQSTTPEFVSSLINFEVAQEVTVEGGDPAPNKDD